MVDHESGKLLTTFCCGIDSDLEQRGRKCPREVVEVVVVSDTVVVFQSGCLVWSHLSLGEL
jgi:hypothetical protein